MTPQDYMSMIDAEATRMADLDKVSFGAAVLNCPGWDVADLISHTGWVHRWMTYMVGLAEGERPTRETSMAAGLPKVGSAQRPDGDLVSWFKQGAINMLAAFEQAPPDKSLNTLFGVHTPVLLIRRMAHETAVHRWDAERAVGEPGDFDPALAADGVDELLELWVPRTFAYAGFGGTGQTIHLCATGSDDGWLVTVNSQDMVWRRGHDHNAEVSARGSLNDLYLFVWNRLHSSQLELDGNSELLTRWQTAATV